MELTRLRAKRDTHISEILEGCEDQYLEALELDLERCALGETMRFEDDWSRRTIWHSYNLKGFHEVCLQIKRLEAKLYVEAMKGAA